MQQISVNPEGVAAFGASATGLSGEMATAATGAAAAGPEQLGPLLGLIAGDFMAAYSAAHAGHVAGISELSAVLASMGTDAAGAATTYVEQDLDRAAATAAVESELA
ncbi:hypothetical protein EBN03_16240 [Nocardia stercoris]|uniref:ESX-1 secretion-associated protein n=2 Tax=Nocardia stercoris TaxID=2483361 RepID=A0A3M2L2K7_9NOCA|nr:hypothetical protein EBN03_16240 [Nocardia stercoris]